MPVLGAGASGTLELTVNVSGSANATPPNNQFNAGSYSLYTATGIKLLGAPFQTLLLDPALSYPVTLDKTGSGTGSVASTPGSLACDAGCSSINTMLRNGEQISLSAVASPGSDFSGWSGACSGSGNPCVLTMQGSALNVTASFVPRLVASVATPSTVLTAGQAATAFAPVTASGGRPPFSFSVSPSLPAGLAMDSGTGTITGTASGASPATSYTVTVQDASLATATAGFQLATSASLVASPALATTWLSVNQAAPPFIPVTASGGSTPLTFSVSPALPSGLSMAAGTGTVFGTPSASLAPSLYTVTVTDANLASSSASFQLGVAVKTASASLAGIAAGPGTQAIPAGTALASISGGSGSCGFDSSQFTAPSAMAPGLPSGPLAVQYGFQFNTTDCGAGASVTITLSFPQPLPAGANSSSWLVFHGAQLSPDARSISYRIDDNGVGDANPAPGPDQRPGLAHAGCPAGDHRALAAGRVGRAAGVPARRAGPVGLGTQRPVPCKGCQPTEHSPDGRSLNRPGRRKAVFRGCRGDSCRP